MKHLFTLLLAFAAGITTAAAARWNAETTDWSRNPHPVIGDWGFDRPGYPKGLYIHGITVKEGQKVKNPVIYDNDVYDDVFEDEWMYAMASLGRMEIAGLIVTPVLTDFWTFSHPDCLPPITVGTEAESEAAGERKMSAGAELYVKLINEHHAKHPDRPMIVNIGGQGATLASAFCLDPTIADKCIVYYTDLRVYNGHYEWASRIIAANFRVVSWGDDNWWIVKKCQNEWNVLPRPDNCRAEENDAMSGEWRLLTEMHNPMLDHMVHQFRHRNEYCGEGRCGDSYGDGTFIHAWLPGIFTGAALQEVRGGEVLHVTSFTEQDEAEVKALTMGVLLDPRAYRFKK